jgi:hypothetical protein
MKSLTGALLALVLIAACATLPPRPPAAGTPFRGEVWTWDDQRHIVTLRQGDRTIRVQTTPEQIAALRLHAVTTVYGTLAPPDEIERIVLPAPPTALVPRGLADQVETAGTVAGIDPVGKLTVNSPRGPLQVWVSTSAADRYPQGAPVRVRVTVQPLDAVAPAVAGPDARPSGARPVPPPATAPGDYAAVVGQILAVDPAGRLIVDSPRGPIEVAVPDPRRYRIGDTVEVQTAIHPGP